MGSQLLLPPEGEERRAAGGFRFHIFLRQVALWPHLSWGFFWGFGGEIKRERSSEQEAPESITAKQTCLTGVASMPGGRERGGNAFLVQFGVWPRTECKSATSPLKPPRERPCWGWQQVWEAVGLGVLLCWPWALLAGGSSKGNKWPMAKIICGGERIQGSKETHAAPRAQTGCGK